MNNICQKCPTGYRFDGSSCIINTSAISCSDPNALLIGDSCECKSGYHSFNNSCLACP